MTAIPSVCLTALERAIQLLNDPDKTVTRGVISLFLTSLIENNKAGISSVFDSGKIGFEVLTATANSKYFFVIISDIGSISMQHMQKMTNHENVQEITIEINPRTDKIQARISIYNTTASCEREPVKYEPPEELEIELNERMVGLIINSADKAVAKQIIEYVMNKSEDGDRWLPDWYNSHNNEKNEFVLKAVMIKTFTLSFYRFLKEQEPAIKNVNIELASIDGTTGLAISFFVESGTEDDIPAPKTKVDHLRQTKNTSIKKNGNGNGKKPSGYLDAFKRVLGF